MAENRKRREIELLVPASSLEVLKIAVIYGADAVYIGKGAFLQAQAVSAFSRQGAEHGG